jgi:membrane protein
MARRAKRKTPGLQKAKADAERRQSERSSPVQQERAREPGRGREAEKPTEIPWPGWKDILTRVKDEIGEDRVLLIAAGTTFYLLLALVPTLTALVSIYGLFADPATVEQHLASLEGVIPGGGMDILRDQLHRLAAQESGSLSLAFIVSLAIALWSSNSGVKSLFEAMNVAYDETEKRGFIKLNLVSLAFTLAGIVGVIFAVGLVIVLPVVLKFIGLGSGTEWLIRIGGYVLLAALASLGVAALYRWGPSRALARWRWLTPGSILTVVVWLIASLLFSWYVTNFGSYNATYGSLGAIIGFMTWMWISVIILIVGAEINSEIEHQTARDSTTGPAKPLGARGATMADTVGKAASGGADETSDGRERGRDRHGGSGPRLAFALPWAALLTYLRRRRDHPNA